MLLTLLTLRRRGERLLSEKADVTVSSVYLCLTCCKGVSWRRLYSLSLTRICQVINGFGLLKGNFQNRLLLRAPKRWVLRHWTIKW